MKCSDNLLICYYKHPSKLVYFLLVVVVGEGGETVFRAAAGLARVR